MEITQIVKTENFETICNANVVDQTYGSSEHVKHERAQTPPVNCFAMSTTHKNFWCPITTFHDRTFACDAKKAINKV